MTQVVAIVQEQQAGQKRVYRAIRGREQAIGSTPGQALDSLETLFTTESGQQNTSVIVQRFAPDEFFTAEQQDRLQTLMTCFHEKRLLPAEQSELEQLIEAEWQAAIQRTSVVSSPSANTE